MNITFCVHIFFLLIKSRLSIKWFHDVFDSSLLKFIVHKINRTYIHVILNLMLTDFGGTYAPSAPFSYGTRASSLWNIGISYYALTMTNLSIYQWTRRLSTVNIKIDLKISCEIIIRTPNPIDVSVTPLDSMLSRREKRGRIPKRLISSGPLNFLFPGHLWSLPWRHPDSGLILAVDNRQTAIRQ